MPFNNLSFSAWRNQSIRITDESHSFTVRRPGTHVDCSLSPIYISDNFGLAASNGHEPKVDALVKRVIAGGYIPGEAQEANPLTIGRDVREPIIVIVICYLLLVASVRLHPPDLHRTGARWFQVSVLPI